MSRVASSRPRSCTPLRRKMSGARRRLATTLRIDRPPAEAVGIRDHCTLTVLYGPDQGSVFAFDSAGGLIGRGVESDCLLDDPGVSGRHAELRFSASGFVIEDLRSTNGTYVNGKPLSGRRLLGDGDRIQIGQATLLSVAIHDASEQRMATDLYHAAICDPLTRLYNRGFFEDRLRAEFAFAARHGDPLSILFMDLDHFSRVNNTWGHQAGDRVLQQTAICMASQIRAEDILARYGGEEFVLIARATALEPGLMLAERLRSAVEQLAMVWEGEAIRVTTSIGLASFDARRSPYTSAAALVASADKAVYRAKQAGRNCVRSI